ncbi:hypothetical protein EMMF5_003963 [Cystobasidiomycetes sp. EMM_F5]
MDEVQIGIALVVIYLLHRWWSSSSSGSSAPSNASGPSSRDPIAAAADRYNALAATIPASSIEQASAMFPQFDDRHLRWEFVRTGRVRTLEQLAQGLLDDRAPPPPPPHPSFLPVQPASRNIAGAASSSVTTRAKVAKHESLIDRLGLQAQASEQDKEFAASGNVDSTSLPEVKGKGKAVDAGWAGLSLQQKKERFVLEARRQALQKDRTKKLASTS